MRAISGKLLADGFHYRSVAINILPQLPPTFGDWQEFDWISPETRQLFCGFTPAFGFSSFPDNVAIANPEITAVS